MNMILGCIADDSTGATDLASTLVRGGMRTVQLTGVPAASLPPPDADAVVVALKSRTISPTRAVADSLAALSWLRDAGARQIFFKYCSTFDSTDAGNIGPVADALLDVLGSDFTIACPAFPANGRTLYMGHLFVGTQLLSESGMRDHPLTPMTDPNLVRVLGRQTSAQVGLIACDTVGHGTDAIRARMEALRGDGIRYAIVDALSDGHLRAIGQACHDLPLITGGSGVAMGLPDNYRERGWLKATGDAAKLSPAGGYAAVLSGSCSVATLAQVEAARGAGWPVLALDPLTLADGDAAIDALLAQATHLLAAGPVLIHASAPPAAVARVQAALGRERAGALVEHAMAALARGLVAHGVRRLVVAGGETAGAVVNVLGAGALRIGPEICPGVPWTESLDRPGLFLALKSGNFGGPDFFSEALACLPREAA